MPDFLLELFSEEIPARMQARGADELARLLGDALAPLAPAGMRRFYGPRRIACAMALAAEVPASSSVERGPRLGAPEQALAGFLRKHGAAREALREEGGFFVLARSRPATPAATLIAETLPALLRRFAWPKSMRWGGTSSFTWVRPLRRILCVLDGETVPFALGTAEDDAHGLVAGDTTEGHRFHAPHAFAVRGVEEWGAGLYDARVIADQDARRAAVAEGVADAAAARHLAIVPDDGLLDEVTGLVEWPVALLGRIDDAFMDLPPEVMQVSMRVNQRYFATRDAAGAVAPYFVSVANIEAADGGAAIVAGNERVLRARFSDARHFWDLDRRTTLAARVPALDGVVFHAKLGTQGARAQRIAALARAVAQAIGADAAEAERAGLLAKADLTTGMVGEFPELQGVMGGYYARHDGEPDAVADAVRDHYLPRGAGDAVPRAPVSVSVALADKIDQIVSFFGVGERPGGSGDPFALRRAALGIVRILRENGLRTPLRPLLDAAGAPAALRDEVLDFLRERLRVVLRGEGVSHEALQAAFAGEADDDLVRLATKSGFLARFLDSEDGASLLAGYKRASNILRIEWAKTGEDEAAPAPHLFTEAEEGALHAELLAADTIAEQIAAERYAHAFGQLGALRAPVDRFFDRVLVNDERPEIRANRLRLLALARRTMNAGANFKAITG